MIPCLVTINLLLVIAIAVVVKNTISDDRR